ncbi:MAG: VWA domain-containing protein, partial [Clostridia bacterium]|nr:VWA domain-containing protein [Clostridia bacterium]
MKIRKKNAMLRGVIALLLCIAQLMPVFAAAAQTGNADRYSSVAVSGNTIKKATWDLYDSESDGIVSGPDYESLDDFVKKMGKIPDEEAVANKSVYFESAADAEQGIVKVVLDMAAGEVKPSPINVVFILDRSGSMNQYLDNSAKTDNWTVPCLNPKHYYKFGNSKKIYAAQESGSTLDSDSIVVEFGVKGSKLDTWFTSVVRETGISGYSYSDVPHNHYDKDGNKITPAPYPYQPKPANYDQHHRYYSYTYQLNGGDNQCIDRATLAREGIIEFANRVFEQNPDSQVGFTSFDGAVHNTIGLKDKEAWDVNSADLIMSDRTGGQQTWYQYGLEEAYNQIIEKLSGENDTEENRAKLRSRQFVVMISDGFPHGSHSGIKGAADNLKKYATVYSIGMAVNQAGAATAEEKSLWATIPTDSQKFRNCVTNEEFIGFLNEIKGQILSVSTDLTDILGDKFTVYEGVDGSHKATLQKGTAAPVEYDRLSNVPEVEINGKQVKWTPSKLTEEGMRLTFYAKLTDISLDAADAQSNSDGYRTNASAQFVYKVDGKENVNQSLDSNCELRVKTAQLTVTKSNSPDHNTYVSPEDEIVYTFEASASGDFDFEGVKLTDVIPAGLENASETRTLDFGTVEAGGTAKTETISVTVAEGTNAIVNFGTFTSTTTGDATANTNEVKNVRSTTLAPVAYKTVNRAVPAAEYEGDFTFTLSCGQAGVILPNPAKAVNGAGGEIQFGSVRFTEPNTYTFMVTESETSVPGMTISSPQTFTVDVTVDSNGNLTATQTPTPTLDNVYTAEGSVTFEGTKTLDGRSLTANDVFEFEVREDGEVVATGESDATGKITFTEISYDLNSVGNHTYTVTEKAGSIAGVTYATTSYDVTVN